MKRSYRWISMCLAVSMALMVFPMPASAEPITDSARPGALSADAAEDTITSGADGMTVTLDKNFPSVVGYELSNGKKMDGQITPVSKVSIGLLNANPVNSWRDYVPRKVEYVKDGVDSAVYKLYIANQDGSGTDDGADDLFEITVNYKVEGKTLVIDTTSIVDKKPDVAKLKSINYPGNSLLSVDPSTTSSAQLAAYWTEVGYVTDFPPTGNSITSPNSVATYNTQYDCILDLKSGLDITRVEMPYKNTSTQNGKWLLDTAGSAIAANRMSNEAGIAILTNGELAATVINNRASEKYRFKYTVDSAGGAVTAGRIEDGRHYYRHDISEGTKAAFPDYNDGGLNMQLLQDNLPLTKVYIDEDLNDDAKIDWQDGALIYRHAIAREKDSTQDNRGMTHMPVNNDYIRNSVLYINHNLNHTNSTFYRATDIVKKVYNLTDGFGQRPMIKGYQAWGHDDSHPDYGNHFGPLMGGMEGFQKMTEIGAEYNARYGVHLNAYGVQADAFYADPRTHDGRNGYKWVDSTPSMFFERDMLSGQLYGRLMELKKNAPLLSWVYLDCWWHADWVGRHVMEIYEQNDWMIMTEFGGSMPSFVSGTHWGNDIGYPDQGQNVSQLRKFIMYNNMETPEPDPLLRGSFFLQLGSWRGHDYYNSVDIFNAVDLPNKYLQHFELLKYEAGEQAALAGGVKSVKEGDRTVIYGVGGKKIADLNYDIDYRPNQYGNGRPSTVASGAKLFIPWTEDVDFEAGMWDSDTEFRKAYAYHRDGGTETWEVPDGWTGSVELYKLTDVGRDKISDIDIVDGKVTLTLEARIGYIVYPKNFDVKKIAAAANWGEDTLIPDNSFTSHTFDFWNKSSSSADTSHITMAQDTGKVDYLNISGNSPDATVWQDLSVEPGTNYTASVWVQIGGNNNNSARKTKLVIEDMDGNVLGENFVTRNMLQNYITEHQYYSSSGENRATRWIHPLKVKFTAPADGRIRYKLVAEATTDTNASVYFNWADIKEFFTDPGYDMNDPAIAFYEDFENLDQNWGSIEKGRSTSNQSHIAENYMGDKYADWYVPSEEENKMGITVNVPEAGLQPFSYAIDGRFTLYLHDAETGEIARTLPQSLRLQPNKTYKLSFDYKSYDDNVSAQGPLYEVAVKARAAGDTSYVDLLRAKIDQTPKAYTHNTHGYYVQENEPDPVHVEYIFETGSYRSLDDPNDGDIYLTFNKLVSGETIGMLVDNIVIQETDEKPVPEDPVTPPAVDLTRIQPSRARANQAQSGEGAGNVLVEDMVLWHSPWSGVTYPCYLEIDLGKETPVSKIELVKRSSGTNGVILAGEVYYHETEKGGTWPGGSGYLSNGEWTKAKDIPTRGSAGNVPAVDTIVFDTPITTRYLRINVTNGSGGFASLERFRAYGEEKTPQSVTAADVTTFVGKVPSLPATGTVTFTDGSTVPVNISWPSILPSQVSSPGSFQVAGKVGLDAPLNEVTLTVNVKSSFDGAVAPIIIDASTIGIKMDGSVTGLVRGNFEVSFYNGVEWIKTPFTFNWNNTTKIASFTVSEFTQNNLQLRILNIFGDEERDATIADRVIVTAKAGPGGSISPGSSAVFTGDSLTFSITANQGYRIVDVLVNGSSVDNVASYTFENIRENAAIEAVFAPLGENAILSVGYSGFTSLVSGCAANIPMTVTAENPDGLDIYAGLFVDGALVASAKLTDGKATIKAPAFTGSKAYVAAWFAGSETDMATAKEINLRQLPDNIWTPEFYNEAEEGMTIVIFGDDISLTASATVKADGITVTKFSTQGPVLTIESEITEGQIVEIKGVKYPGLFPSYSFTFKLIR